MRQPAPVSLAPGADPAPKGPSREPVPATPLPIAASLRPYSLRRPLMSTAPPASACPVCQQPLPGGPREDCPSCHTPAAALELLDAVDFVARRFAQWHEGGQLNARQHQAIADDYAGLRREI